MKTLTFILLLFISSIGFSQNNHIVKTEDGRRVLLKADFTWEYIDLDSPNANHDKTLKAAKKEGCKLAKDFSEYKLNKKIQSQLKRGRASIKYVKQKVAKDHGCSVDDVLLISAKEQKAKATYVFCAYGKQVTYKRIGNSILKKGKLF
ncbi:DUF3157 family protein [uncultured Algibacter sp.]|uniref:DUF3157 family protein n=1 Tax=uncultured Algibacter sp. TaxID=298659 RepID=UPI003216F8C8